MQIDLTELKTSLPTALLATMLQRATQQIETDTERYANAIHAGDFIEAAQIIHSVRGLALFLGVPVTELSELQALENALQAYGAGHNTEPIDSGPFVNRFDVFRAAFGAALHQASDNA